MKLPAWSVLVVAAAVAVGGAAVAQPTVTDPSRRPTRPAPPPAPAAPAAPATPPIKIIRLDQSGQPIEEPTVDPGAFYYDDGSGQMYEEPQTIHFGPTPQHHVVRSGDTLWDISWFYFNDPWQWPKVWSYNPQITNPHWIYPADLVRLYPQGQFVTEPTPEPGGDGNGGGATEPDPDPLPTPVRRTGVNLRQTAFVEQSDLETAMRIDGSVEDKQLLATGDLVYVSYPENRPPKVGNSYSVYLADQEVAGHGAYVRILGRVRIDEVKKKRRAKATIMHATAEIERGALVGKLVTEIKTVPPVPARKDLTGEIIAMLHRDQLIGEGEVIFVNLGEKSGIEVGNRMFVIRRGDAFKPESTPDALVGQDDDRFPQRALGQIIIVEVGRNMSIALVTLSVQEMQIGDHVVMQRATSSE
jgi:hypothetical protein